jgi:PadR family transcriptional regulator, regulatory protein PadR
MDDLDKNYITVLLAGWEETYKKGMLSFWILDQLAIGPKHMAEISASLDHYSKGAKINVDDKSMYRALRRLADADVITHKLVPSKSGPDLKVYTLTSTGQELLKAFRQRFNI